MQLWLAQRNLLSSLVGALLGTGLLWGQEQSAVELPKLDDLIDLSKSEPGDALEAEDAQAFLEEFWQQQGIETDTDFELPLLGARPALRIPPEQLRDGQGNAAAGGQQQKPAGEPPLLVHSRDELLYVSAPRGVAGDFLRITERLRERLQELLGKESQQRYLCVLNFYSLPALQGEPISALRIRAYEKLGYRIELSLRDGDGLNALSLQRLLVRMLLLERVAQGALARDAQTMPEVPDWLVVGVAEMMRYLSGNLDARLFRQALQAGSELKLAEVLNYREDQQRDGAARLQELGCAALVHALLGSGEGNFLRWLLQAEKEADGQLQELQRFFVEFGLENEELDKSYLASWVKLAQSSALERYTVAESRELLLQSLVSLRMVDEGMSETEDGLSVAQCLELWAQTGELDEVLLAHWQQVLLAFQERVHPLFGGVVIRSRRMFQALAAGKMSIAQAQQNWAAELREMEVILAMMDRINLRLNEYQLNFGGGDLAWIEELKREPAFDRSRSLLPRRGLLQRRLDWAQEKWKLEAFRKQQKAEKESSLENLPGLEDLEEVSP